MQVALTRGKVATIDDEDCEKVAPYNWYTMTGHKTWYAAANIKKPNGSDGILFMHRLLMDAREGEEVDHKNGDGLDNRRSTNLRFCTHSENGCNSSVNTRNTSGYRGVHWEAWTQRWKAQICIHKKVLNLGRYDDPVVAAHVRDAKAIELHGEFAVLNFPNKEASWLLAHPQSQEGQHGLSNTPPATGH